MALGPDKCLSFESSDCKQIEKNDVIFFKEAKFYIDDRFVSID